MLQTILRRPTTAKDTELGCRLCEASGRLISPVYVSKVLTKASVKHVVIGAHAINGYTGRPRATADVDVIVQCPKKATAAVMAAVPELIVQDTAVAAKRC